MLHCKVDQELNEIQQIHKDKILELEEKNLSTLSEMKNTYEDNIYNSRQKYLQEKNKYDS